MGATGAGKTTITNLINRFYDIADGKIRYDGINVNKIRKSDLRRSLGVVLQDVNLFTGTVMDNIRYGNLDATDEECIKAAKLAGADVVLLIAAALTVDECKALGKLAHQLEMEVLLEIHTEKELDYLHEHVDLIGVNNRNLGTFHTDVENSFRLARKLPKELLWVSESGISQPDTFRQLREAGFRGFLMGETFMKTPSPEKALSNFLQALAL